MKKLIAKILNLLFNHGNKHPYLEEIGVHSYPANHFGGISTYKMFGDLSNLRRQKRIAKKTKVDPRDCWELEGTFYMWIYEHLKQYMKDADGFVNLEYHIIEHNGKAYTQKALIEYLEDLAKNLILFDEFKDCPEIHYTVDEETKTIKCTNSQEEIDLNKKSWTKNMNDYDELRKELCSVLYKILPYMWW